MVDKGVSWNVGKVYFRDELLYSFDLLPEAGHERPAFINLQQYYVEGYLAETRVRAAELEIRWKNKWSRSRRTTSGATLGIETPDGRYGSRPTMWSPATARARRCARCSARKARAACSATAS